MALEPHRIRPSRAARGAAGTRTALAVAAVAVVALAGYLLTRQPETPVPPAPTTSSTEPSVTEPTTTAPTTAPAAEGRSFLVASPDGVSLVTGGEVVRKWPLGPVLVALDDHDRGLVLQIGVSASSILHLAAGSEDPVEIVPAEPGEVLTLHEVADIDSSPTVVYTARITSETPAEVREELRLHRLEDGTETTVASVPAYERATTRVSWAADRFVLSETAEGVTWFEARSADGDLVDLAGNPRTEDRGNEEFLVWAGHAVQSPDGSSLAFLRGSPRSEAPFELVVVDLPSGEERFAVPVSAVREDTVTRLDWDGDVAVVSTSGSAPVLVGPDGVIGTLPTEGTASPVR